MTITRMQQKRGTAAEWLVANPILAEGEIGFETNTGVLKVGDGVTTWNNLVPILKSVLAPTAAEWASDNPILGEGVVGIERDTLVIKIGDGVTAWNSLAGIPGSEFETKEHASATFSRNGSLLLAQQTLAADPDAFRALVLGDSQGKRPNYPQFYVQLEKHMLPGMGLAGMLPGSLIDGGNPGLTPTTWMTPTNGVENGPYPKSAFLVDAPSLRLIILLFNGLNSLRLGGTQDDFEAELRVLLTFLVASAPQASILLPTPPALTTTVVGTDYLANATLTQAQTRTNMMRQGVLAMQGFHPNVKVVDMGADVFGTEVKATSPLMIDQLHWNSLGQRRAADYLVGHIAPRTQRLTAVAPVGTRYLRVATVVSAGNGSITISAFDELGMPASEWIPSPNDTLHIPRFGTTGTVALSGTAFIPAAANLTLSKAGTDFSSVAVGTVVVITGDHAQEASGRRLVTIDPPAVPANDEVTFTAALTGVRFNATRPPMALAYQCPVLVTGLSVSLVRISADDTVQIRLRNHTGAEINPASDTWAFFLTT